MTSNIVRDEIGHTNSVIQFISNMKMHSAIFSKNIRELEGVKFLDTRGSGGIFFDIFSKYHAYMASEQGITESFDLNEAFIAPCAPTSVERYGQLLFHNPFKDNSKGKLFELGDLFGSHYARNPYRGQPFGEKQKYEKHSPLFFRYLNLLYEFRCAYFHGELPINEQINELARSAYTSLREIYPAILR